MAASRELTSLIENAETVASLIDIYERTLGRILRELSLGITQPGGARARELIARIRDLILELDPSRDGKVRAWIRETVHEAFVLGDDAATRQLRESLSDLSSGDRQAWGEIATGWTAVNQTAMRAIISSMDETLRQVASQMQSQFALAVRRTQLVLHTDQAIREATVSGIIRGATGRQLSDDIANIILEGRGGPEAIARLREQGFQPDLLKLYERLAKGQVVRVGARNYDVRAYANLVARTMLRDAHKVATLVRLQQNSVNHVRISVHVQKEPDVCTAYAGQVFYIGQGEDPLGFPSIKGIPNSGPPFHPNCAHVPEPWVLDFKTAGQIEDARIAAELLPENVFGKTAADVTKFIEELTPAQLEAILPNARKILPEDYFTQPPAPPIKGAA